MTPAEALTVQSMAKDGYGWTDICARLGIKEGSDDGKEIRRYVLGLGSKVARRYGT